MAAAGALWSLALLTKIHAWFLLPILGAWALRWLPPRRAALRHGRLGRRRNQLVLARLALALVRLRWPGFRAYWGTGVAQADDHGAVLRPGLRRSRRALALPLVLLRRDRAARLAAPGRARARPRLEKPPRPIRSRCSWPARSSSSWSSSARSVPVYDGERLFLHVFPAWALLIGLGFGSLWNHSRPPAVRPRVGSSCAASCWPRATARSRCTRLG